MTELVTRTPADLAAILGLNLNDPATQGMIAVCAAYNLDPLLKHVIVLPGKGPYLTRDGLLHIAHSSGQLDGIEIVNGPDLIDGEWRVTVSVYRKDWSRPVTYPGRYSAKGKNQAYAPEMAIARAESMALRRAFSITGIPSLDEVDTDQAQTAPTPRNVNTSTGEIVDAVVIDTVEDKIARFVAAVEAAETHTRLDKATDAVDSYPAEYHDQLLAHIAGRRLELDEAKA